MSKTNDKGPYHRLVDLLATHEAKLVDLKAELLTLERDQKNIASAAIDAFVKDKTGADYKAKKEAVTDGLIAIEAMKREIALQEKAIAKTRERLEEERKNEPARIRERHWPAYVAAIRKLHKAYLGVEDLEADVQRIYKLAQKEQARLGLTGGPYRPAPLPKFPPIVVPDEGEGTRKYGRMGRFEKDCKNRGIEL